MTGPSHRLMAAAGAILLGGSPLEAAAATLGARLPDQVEVIGIPHRGVSHWPWPWVFAVWVLWTQHTFLSTILAWWLAGALAHIVADLFTVGGIPLDTSQLAYPLGGRPDGELWGVFDRGGFHFGGNDAGFWLAPCAKLTTDN